MNIFLIRHGETDWNKEHRFQGHEDIELNENGKRQARATGEALIGEPFKAIISSPLIRAKETAEIIGETLEMKDIIIEKGIIERDLGRLSGLNPKEREILKASGEDTLLEDVEELQNRMLLNIKKYAELYYPENIIMVSHGGSIYGVLKALHENKNQFEKKVILKNACISIVEYDNEVLKLDDYNLTGDEYRAKRKL